MTNADMARLETLNPEIPRDLATNVHKAIDRDPGHRYQTSQQLGDDLQANSGAKRNASMREVRPRPSEIIRCATCIARTNFDFPAAFAP
ncbi:MAG: hypothetical protein NT069_18435 [Planctomycetota bacterium]|nr:hypothetical protein [Planctomycetota bacterium]